MAVTKKICGEPSGCLATSLMDCNRIKDNPEKNHFCYACKVKWPKGKIVKDGQYPKGIWAYVSQSETHGVCA
jgi:hypothetical protein